MISHRGSLLAIVLVVLVPTSGLTQARLVQGDPAQNRASQQAQTGRPLQPQPANPELTDPEKVTELMALIGELNKWLDSRKDAKNNAAGVLPDAQASLNKLKLRGVRLSGQKRVIDNAAWVASVIHDEYKGLKDAPKDSRSGVSRLDIQDLHTNSHALLDRLNLLSVMGTVLRTGYVVADVGDDGKEGTFETNPDSMTNAAAGIFEFETKHFGDEESPLFHVSAAGSVGLMPRLTVVRPRADSEGDTDDTTEPTPQPLVGAYQSGFGFRLGGRGNIQTGSRSEAGIFITGGMNRLTGDTVKLGDGDDARVADTLTSRLGNWASVWEVGADFRLYDAPLWIKHDEQSGILDPVLHVAAGLRWDNRFQSHRGSLDGLDAPQERQFVRVGLNLREILDRRQTAKEDAKALAFRFIVEHEWSRHRGTIPAGTMLMIEASTDLLKLVGFGSSTPAPQGDATARD